MLRNGTGEAGGSDLTQEAVCQATQQKRKTARGWLTKYGATIILAVLLVFIIRWKVVQPFYIPSSSMEPTLQRHDRIIVSKISYVLGEPKRWDVVIFMEPGNHGRNFVKRVVGLPGEKVQLIAGEVYINGKHIEKPTHLRNISYTHEGRWGTSRAVEIPENSYYVLGDNSSRSNDSRCWARPFVRRAEILGEAVGVAWPPGRAGRVH